MHDHPDELAAVVFLTLVSGGFMFWAGALLAAGSLNTALWASLPALMIEIASWLVRRADRDRGFATPSLGWRLKQEGLLWLAGGIMLLAGYLAAAVIWVLAIPLLAAGGFVAAAGLIGRDPERKRRLVRAAERYVANPPTIWALRRGLPMPLALLETIGRTSGKRRQTPVMNGLIDGQLWVVAEHGMRAGYVRNLLADPHVRVKIGRTWREGIATILADDAPYERITWIAQRLGRPRLIESAAARLFCVNPATVLIDLEPSSPQQREASAGRVEEGAR